jgi:hypothetical protein
LLEEDFRLAPDAPGGMVKYRLVLVRSFYYKFFAWAQAKLCEDHWHNQGLEFSMDELSAVQSHSTHKFSDTFPLAKGLQHYDRENKIIDPNNPNNGNACGVPNRHLAADYQVSGKAEYVDDIPMNRGELFMDFVLSPHAHAKILAINEGLAYQVQGCVSVITYEDIPGKNNFGPIKPDEQFLPELNGEVHHVGAIVCCTVGVTRAAARAAAKALEKGIVYEVLPAIVTIQQAIEQKSFHATVFNQGKSYECIHTLQKGPEKDGGKTMFEAKNIEELFKKMGEENEKVRAINEKLLAEKHKGITEAAKEAAHKKAEEDAAAGCSPCSPGRNAEKQVEPDKVEICSHCGSPQIHKCSRQKNRCVTIHCVTT